MPHYVGLDVSQKTTGACRKFLALTAGQAWRSTLPSGSGGPHDPECNCRGLVANSSVGRTRGCADPILRFVGLRKSEADQQHLVLLAHCPRAGEAKALS